MEKGISLEPFFSILIINNAESERSNSRGVINKSKEEQEEDTKNDMITITTATTKRIEKATLL